MPENQGPLKNVKIVDLTRALAGPTCTMIMADMGAETIKVELIGKIKKSFLVFIFRHDVYISVR